MKQETNTLQEEKSGKSRRLGLTGLAVAGILAAMTVGAAPALGQTQESTSGEDPSGTGTADVTFELTVDGEVPEGRTLGLDLPGTADIFGTFCSTASEDRVPRCEDGETYTATFFSIGNTVSTGPFPVAVGGSQSYEYTVSSNTGPIEVFEAGTVTPTEDTTVSVTYQAGDDPGDQGPPQDQYDPGEQTPNPENGGDQYDPNEAPDTGNGGDQYEGEPTTSPSTGGGSSSGASSGASGSPESPVTSGAPSSGSGAGLSILPDTGGSLGLWSAGVAGLGVALVAGGVFLRRLLG